MASALLYLIFFLPFSAQVQQTNGAVAVGASLTATDNVMPWLSPSGDFAFGFQRIGGGDYFLLSIWYHKVPDKTIVWYVPEAPEVPSGSKVELTTMRGLVLTDPQGTELWTSEPISGPVAYGLMNDTGNFLLVRSDSSSLWESFNFPTHTLLPAQVMGTGGVLYSQMRRTNFSSGRFQLRLLEDGNLVLNTRDVLTNWPYDPYYVSGTSDPSDSSNSGYQLIFNQTGYMYVLRRNGQQFDLTPKMALPTTDYYHRATLTFDGVFAQYTYPKNLAYNSSWTAMWSEPENICFNITGLLGSGACGYNSICTLDDRKRPNCECPEGYSFLDASDPYGDCKPNNSIQTCDGGVFLNSGGDLYDFVELNNTDFLTSDYELSNQTSEEECRTFCSNDCFCAAAIYFHAECWRKKLPLSNGRKGPGFEGKALLKVRKGNLPQSPTKRDHRILFIVGLILLPISVIIFVVAVCLCIRRKNAACLSIHRKKPDNLPGNFAVQSTFDLQTNLHHFSYQQLAEATNGFVEELGTGAYGIVYKGEIKLGSESTVAVAVKKLMNRVVQDRENDFKTELKAIARTHHRNLVHLIGFCDEGEHKLLVYEYMSKGTLANFLFGDTKPSSSQRIHIAVGIARGLLYLHDECSTQIIHCDIKPANVLLDESENARISDFGIAKLLRLGQSRTVTEMRGTFGYVAPEWLNQPITTKVDVYSFGILLLEIVSCRRWSERIQIAGNEVLLHNWAWACYQAMEVDAFVQNDLEASSDDFQKLKTYVMVGLWCIQHDPDQRPSMKKVIHMLEGVTEVDEPPCPFPVSGLNGQSPQAALAILQEAGSMNGNSVDIYMSQA